MLVLQPPQQIYNLRSHAHIQRRNRFIQNQQLRPQRQRAGNVDALPLSSAELVRIAAQRRFVEAHLMQKLDRLRAQGGGVCLYSGLVPMDEQRLGDNLLHSHTWIQGGVGILEDGLHLAAQAAQLGARCPCHVDAVHADAAMGGFHQTQNHPRQRCLARS